MPNYSVDAVVSVDGEHYTARISVKSDGHCPQCGKRLKPGNHTALVKNGTDVEVWHSACVPAWRKPAVVKP